MNWILVALVVVGKTQLSFGNEKIGEISLQHSYLNSSGELIREKVGSSDFSDSSDFVAALKNKPSSQQDWGDIPGAGGWGSDPSNQVIQILDDIFNFGKDVFSFITENKPSIDSKLDWASALPKTMTQEAWEDMGGWKEPIWHHFEFEVKTVLGIRMAKVPFYVFYTAGGQYQPAGAENGKGRYLVGISVREDGLSASWANKISATVKVNVGNANTSAEPIAFADLAFDLLVDGPLESKKQTANFYIKGDGTFKVKTLPK